MNNLVESQVDPKNKRLEDGGALKRSLARQIGLGLADSRTGDEMTRGKK